MFDSQENLFEDNIHINPGFVKRVSNYQKSILFN